MSATCLTSRCTTSGFWNTNPAIASTKNISGISEKIV